MTRSIPSHIRYWLHGALDLLAVPEGCVMCGDVMTDAWLCDTCMAAFTPIEAFCERCGKPFTHSPCPSCSNWDAGMIPVRSAVVYDDAAKTCVYGLKFYEHLAYGQAMAQLIERQWDHLGLPRQDVTLVPVPLHRRRLSKRQFNQSWVLCTLLERDGYGTAYNCLVRTRNTESQVGKSITQRWDNMLGAFRMKRRAVLSGTVLLVDDVHTTGATLQHCGIILQLGGATNVTGLTFAATEASGRKKDTVPDRKMD